MRTIDTAKRDKVIQTVLQITMEEGLAALSFDKLAKRAGISSGTPYVYYKDKTRHALVHLCTGVAGLARRACSRPSTWAAPPAEKLFFGLRQLAQTLRPTRRRPFLLSVDQAPEFVHG